MSPSNQKRLRLFDVMAVTLFSLVVFVAVKIHQYFAFYLKGELADFELMFWNTLRGDLLGMKYSGVSFFSEHFSPVLLLLVPVYAVFRSPCALLVAQGVVCALAIVPLYYLTTHFTEQRWPPLALSIGYFFYSMVNRGLMYDFHPEIFYPLFFFCVFLAQVKERWTAYYAALILCAAVKEDSFIAIAGLGLFILFSGKKNIKHGIATVFFGIVGLAAVMYYIIPHFRMAQSGSAYKFAGYWGGYGSTPKEMAMNFINPVRQCQVLFTAAKLNNIFKLFLGFAFLPFFCLRGFLFLVLPNWFLLFSSGNDQLNNQAIYYGLLIAPFLYYAAILGINRISSLWPSRRDMLFMVCAALVLTIQISDSRIFRMCRPSYLKVPARNAVAEEIIRLIPKGAPSAAQINLVSHLPPHLQRTNIPDNTDNVDYLMFDTLGDTWPLPKKDYEEYLRKMESDPAWETAAKKEGFLLLKRKKPVGR